MSLSQDELDFIIAQSRIMIHAGSFKVRTTDFESVNDGSISSLATKFEPYPFPRLERYQLLGVA